jgi:hypothetical protein
MKKTQNQKEMAKPIYVIMREDNITKDLEILSIERGIKVLSNFYKKDTIEQMFDNGEALLTPYASYSREIFAFYSEPITIK